MLFKNPLLTSDIPKHAPFCELCWWLCRNANAIKKLFLPFLLQLERELEVCEKESGELQEYANSVLQQIADYCPDILEQVVNALEESCWKLWPQTQPVWVQVSLPPPPKKVKGSWREEKVGGIITSCWTPLLRVPHSTLQQTVRTSGCFPVPHVNLSGWQN